MRVGGARAPIYVRHARVVVFVSWTPFGTDSIKVVVCARDVALFGESSLLAHPRFAGARLSG